MTDTPQRIRILRDFVTDDHPAHVIHAGEIGEYFAHNDCYTFPARPISEHPNAVKVAPWATRWRTLRWLVVGRAEVVETALDNERNKSANRKR